MGVVDRLSRGLVESLSTRQSKPVSYAAGPRQTSVFAEQLTTLRPTWKASSVGYRCVASIASNAASVPLVVADAAGTEHPEHELVQLWATPNPLLSSRVLAEWLWARLETRGEAFVYVDRGPDGTGRAAELWPIFTTVSPVVTKRADGVGELVGFQARGNAGRTIGLLPQEVLWLRYPDPDSEWGALAPLQAAGHAIDLDAYAREWQRGEFRNGARPSNVVFLGDLDDEHTQSIVEDWRSQVAGPANAGKTVFVSSQTTGKVERLTMTPAEMGWLDTRRVSAEEVMLAHGVPKDYLLGGATYENRAASRATLWSDAIIPKLQLVASELTRQMVPETGYSAVFDTSDVEALQESEDARYARVKQAAEVDVLTLDELRAELGYSELPGGLGQVTLSAYRQLLGLQAALQLTAASSTPQLPRAAAVLDVQQLLGVVVPRREVDPADRRTAALGALEQLSPPGDEPVERTVRADVADVLREYERWEQLGRSSVARVAARQQSVVLTNLARVVDGRSRKGRAWLERTAQLLAARDPAAEAPELRAQIDDLFDSEYWAGFTRAELETFVRGAWESGAYETAGALGISFDHFDLSVLLHVDARLDVLANAVTATTRQVLEDRVLLQGIANGESIEQLSERVRQTFTELSTSRAETIARTETIGGFNAASNAIAQASGVVHARIWRATDDSRTRETHSELEGARVEGFGSAYSNGCRHPGDPLGPAAETINCRCYEEFVLS